jgi:hypothetical protein
MNARNVDQFQCKAAQKPRGTEIKAKRIFGKLYDKSFDLVLLQFPAPATSGAAVENGDTSKYR